MVSTATCFARAPTHSYCNHYSWPKQKGFAHRLYTPEGANLLAREWQTRGNHFFCLWRGNGESLDFRFDEERLASYVLSEEFLKAGIVADIDGPVFREIMVVQHVFPVNPPRLHPCLDVRVVAFPFHR